MRVAVIGSKRIDKIREPLESVGVECIIVDIDNIFKKFNPPIDAVITDTPGIGILKGWIVKKVNKALLIYRMRGDYWQEVESEGRLSKVREFIANKLIFRLCDGVIVVNHYLRKEFQKRVRFSGTVAVVGLPIDVARFKFEHNKRCFNIVTLTNFDYWEKIKPIFSYLDTVDKFLKKVGGKWYIAGKGKYVKDFLRAIEKYETVEYCGYVSAPEFLKKGSVMLHFSEFEGLPNAVLEGMAAGLPVIVNDYEPLTEIENVIVVKDKKELEKWLHKVFLNPALRRKLLIRNIKYTDRVHKLHVIGDSYKDAISKCQQLANRTIDSTL